MDVCVARQLSGKVNLKIRIARKGLQKMALERRHGEEGHQEALRRTEEGERSELHALLAVSHFIQLIGVEILVEDKRIHHVRQLLPHRDYCINFVLSKLLNLYITPPFTHKILRTQIIPHQRVLVGIQGMGWGSPQHKRQVVCSFEVPLGIECEVVYVVPPIASYPNVIVVKVECQNKINVRRRDEQIARPRVIRGTF